MSATRYDINLLEILSMRDEGDDSGMEMPLKYVLSAFEPPDIDEGESETIPSEAVSTTQLPDVLPILALRGLVVYPDTAAPLSITQPSSIKMVDDVISKGKIIGLVACKNSDIEDPKPEDLYSIGTAAIIHRLFRAPDGSIRILVQGISRINILEYVATDPYLIAKVESKKEIGETGIEVEALARNARDQFGHIAEMIPSIPRELVAMVSSISDPLNTVYTIANFQRIELTDAQAILELDSVSEKLRKLVTLLTRESEVLELGRKFQNEARSEIEKMQREYFLREQLKAIQKELGEGDEGAAEVEDYKKKIEAAKMPEEAEKQARSELDRLARLSPASAETGVIRTYLDWLVDLPWSMATEDNLDIPHARQVLDEDHYGLKDVKERILEFLSVRKLRLDRREDMAKNPSVDIIRREREGIILCFVGPPGVGKTSLGKSIARALGRKFIRISLGGVRDEAEIRGHRRTYIGSLPGRIIQPLKRVESRNPVFMLDEIDKLSFDYHGDPASALLEVLDPEQNVEFRDHYLEVAFDLSQVMFITTANQLETIPPPLLDRMEVIPLSGYTENEKISIARQYLIPRQLRENGLKKEEITFSEKALQIIIRQYTREAGVRNLERQLGATCRKIVTQITEKKKLDKIINTKNIIPLLGKPHFLPTEEISRRTSIPGVATGLAWTPSGGEILFIEATSMPGSKGFKITGSLGNVMQESAQAAFSYVRSKSVQLGIADDVFEKHDIHMHIPAGATPKDGPSAGVTMATALISLLTGKVISPYLGMTGEITLKGQVLPVGGIKEKLLAAHRAGLKTILLPQQNKVDLDDLPPDVHRSLKTILVDSMDDIIANAFSQEPLISKTTVEAKSDTKTKKKDKGKKLSK